jgi:hypothetical protein
MQIPAASAPPSWAWVGVDLGLKGGVALLTDRDDVHLWRMPLAKHDGGQGPCVAALRGILLAARAEYKVIASIEEPFLLPRQGGALTIGRNWGIVLAAFHLAGVEVEHFRPVVWQDELLEGITHKDPKARAAEWAHREYPHVDFRLGRKVREEHDGVIDALCIAAWRRKKTGWVRPSKETEA